ncbi:MAG: pantothenate kinase [Candidatus Methanoplasma sp.]|jgi:pantoate kinase|nr:pantothenate kinase [Candidatus Methanoplasma sp.]
MTSAYCPAHITCFFRPVHSSDVLSKGSEGAGIRLKAGTLVHAEETHGRTRVFIDGVESEAKITKLALGYAAPGRNFEIHAVNDLPTGQGFGMSAAGAVAAALCAAESEGGTREEAFRAAHAADIVGGGGLGDVSGILCEHHQPTRIKAGLPPIGRAVDSGAEFPVLTVAVLGSKMSTAEVLGNKDICSALEAEGAAALAEYKRGMSVDSLFRTSNAFSKASGVETAEASEAIRRLNAAGIRAAMCMLGNSIFTDAPMDAVKDVLGEVFARETSSTADPAAIIRKA